ncbi:MAG: hypothetical protein GY869_24025, partial [Planctomycetes bacterium]|nr:hypothetical protein [Planctomycetota bacterium]
LDPNTFSGAYGISADGGTVCGMGWRSNWTAEAYYWIEPTGIVPLGQSGSNSTRANDINNDGSIIVGWSEHPSQGYRRPVMWTPEPVLFADDTAGECNRISNNGMYITGSANGNAFIWSEDNGLIDLGTLPGDMGSYSLGVSNNGITGGTSKWGITPGQSVAVMWDEEGNIHEISAMLDEAGFEYPADWIFFQVQDISANGSIMTGIALVPPYMPFSSIGWVIEFDGGSSVVQETIEIIMPNEHYYSGT